MASVQPSGQGRAGKKLRKIVIDVPTISSTLALRNTSGPIAVSTSLGKGKEMVETSVQTDEAEYTDGIGESLTSATSTASVGHR